MIEIVTMSFIARAFGSRNKYKFGLLAENSEPEPLGGAHGVHLPAACARYRPEAAGAASFLFLLHHRPCAGLREARRLQPAKEILQSAS